MSNRGIADEVFANNCVDDDPSACRRRDRIRGRERGVLESIRGAAAVGGSTEDSCGWDWRVRTAADLHTESTFVPVKNCRLVNTAKQGGKIRAGKTRSFYVVGAVGFAAQGGAATGCGIPAAASSISARITAVNVTKSGRFTVYPAGASSSLPALYYTKGQAATTGATEAIAAGSGQVLTVANTAGAANLTIDVNGYYEEQIEGMISPTGKIYSGSNRLLSAEVLDTGEYQVDVDTDVSDCSPMVDTFSQYVYGSAFAFNGNHITVYTWSLDSSTHVETAASDYFYLTVLC
jgi:hypothetical protein